MVLTILFWYEIQILWWWYYWLPYSSRKCYSISSLCYYSNIVSPCNVIRPPYTAEAGKLKIVGNFNTVCRPFGICKTYKGNHRLPSLETPNLAKHSCRTLVLSFLGVNINEDERRGVTHPYWGNGPHSARRHFLASKASRRISQWPGRILKIL